MYYERTLLEKTVKLRSDWTKLEITGNNLQVCGLMDKECSNNNNYKSFITRTDKDC